MALFGGSSGIPQRGSTVPLASAGTTPAASPASRGLASDGSSGSGPAGPADSGRSTLFGAPVNSGGGIFGAGSIFGSSSPSFLRAPTSSAASGGPSGSASQALSGPGTTTAAISSGGALVAPPSSAAPSSSSLPGSVAGSASKPFGGLVASGGASSSSLFSPAGGSGSASGNSSGGLGISGISFSSSPSSSSSTSPVSPGQNDAASTSRVSRTPGWLPATPSSAGPVFGGGGAVASGAGAASGATSSSSSSPLGDRSSGSAPGSVASGTAASSGSSSSSSSSSTSRSLGLPGSVSSVSRTGDATSASAPVPTGSSNPAPAGSLFAAPASSSAWSSSPFSGVGFSAVHKQTTSSSVGASSSSLPSTSLTEGASPAACQSSAVPKVSLFSSLCSPGTSPAGSSSSSSSPAGSPTSLPPTASPEIRKCLVSYTHLKSVLLSLSLADATAAPQMHALFSCPQLLQRFSSLLAPFDPAVDRALPRNTPESLLQTIQAVRRQFLRQAQSATGSSSAGVACSPGQGTVSTAAHGSPRDSARYVPPSGRPSTTTEQTASGMRASSKLEAEEELSLPGWIPSEAVIYEALSAYLLRKFNKQQQLLMPRFDALFLQEAVDPSDPTTLREIEDVIVDEQVDLFWCLAFIFRAAASYSLSSSGRDGEELDKQRPTPDPRAESPCQKGLAAECFAFALSLLKGKSLESGLLRTYDDLNRRQSGRLPGQQGSAQLSASSATEGRDLMALRSLHSTLRIQRALVVCLTAVYRARTVLGLYETRRESEPSKNDESRGSSGDQEENGYEGRLKKGFMSPAVFHRLASMITDDAFVGALAACSSEDKRLLQSRRLLLSAQDLADASAVLLVSAYPFDLLSGLTGDSQEGVSAFVNLARTSRFAALHRGVMAPLLNAFRLRLERHAQPLDSSVGAYCLPSVGVTGGAAGLGGGGDAAERESLSATVMPGCTETGSYSDALYEHFVAQPGVLPILLFAHAAALAILRSRRDTLPHNSAFETASDRAGSSSSSDAHASASAADCTRDSCTLSDSEVDAFLQPLVVCGGPCFAEALEALVIHRDGLRRAGSAAASADPLLLMRREILLQLLHAVFLYLPLQHFQGFERLVHSVCGLADCPGVSEDLWIFAASSAAGRKDRFPSSPGPRTTAPNSEVSGENRTTHQHSHEDVVRAPGCGGTCSVWGRLVAAAQLAHSLRTQTVQQKPRYGGLLVLLSILKSACFPFGLHLLLQLLAALTPHATSASSKLPAQEASDERDEEEVLLDATPHVAFLHYLTEPIESVLLPPRREFFSPANPRLVWELAAPPVSGAGSSYAAPRRGSDRLSPTSARLCWPSEELTNQREGGGPSAASGAGGLQTDRGDVTGCPYITVGPVPVELCIAAMLGFEERPAGRNEVDGQRGADRLFFDASSVAGGAGCWCLLPPGVVAETTQLPLWRLMDSAAIVAGTTATLARERLRQSEEQGDPRVFNLGPQQLFHLLLPEGQGWWATCTEGTSVEPATPSTPVFLAESGLASLDGADTREGQDEEDASSYGVNGASPSSLLDLHALRVPLRGDLTGQWRSRGARANARHVPEETGTRTGRGNVLGVEKTSAAQPALSLLRIAWFVWDAGMQFVAQTGNRLPQPALKAFVAATGLFTRLACWPPAMRVALELVIAEQVYGVAGEVAAAALNAATATAAWSVASLYSSSLPAGSATTVPPNYLFNPRTEQDVFAASCRDRTGAPDESACSQKKRGGMECPTGGWPWRGQGGREGGEAAVPPFALLPRLFTLLCLSTQQPQFYCLLPEVLGGLRACLIPCPLHNLLHVFRLLWPRATPDAAGPPSLEQTPACRGPGSGSARWTSPGCSIFCRPPSNPAASSTQLDVPPTLPVVLLQAQGPSHLSADYALPPDSLQVYWQLLMLLVNRSSPSSLESSFPDGTALYSHSHSLKTSHEAQDRAAVSPRPLLSLPDLLNGLAEITKEETGMGSFPVLRSTLLLLLQVLHFCPASSWTLSWQQHAALAAAAATEAAEEMLAAKRATHSGQEASVIGHAKTRGKGEEIEEEYDEQHPLFAAFMAPLRFLAGVQFGWESDGVEDCEGRRERLGLLRAERKTCRINQYGEVAPFLWSDPLASLTEGPRTKGPRMQSGSAFREGPEREPWSGEVNHLERRGWEEALESCQLRHLEQQRENFGAVCEFVFSSVWVRLPGFTFLQGAERAEVVEVVLAIVGELFALLQGVNRLPTEEEGEDTENLAGRPCGEAGEGAEDLRLAREMGVQLRRLEKRLRYAGGLSPGEVRGRGAGAEESDALKMRLSKDGAVWEVSKDERSETGHDTQNGSKSLQGCRGSSFIPKHAATLAVYGHVELTNRLLDQLSVSNFLPSLASILRCHFLLEPTSPSSPRLEARGASAASPFLFAFTNSTLLSLSSLDFHTFASCAAVTPLGAATLQTRPLQIPSSLQSTASSPLLGALAAASALQPPPPLLLPPCVLPRQSTASFPKQRTGSPPDAGEVACGCCCCARRLLGPEQSSFSGPLFFKSDTGSITSCFIPAALYLPAPRLASWLYSPTTALGRWSSHWSGITFLQNVPACLTSAGAAALGFQISSSGKEAFCCSASGSNAFFSGALCVSPDAGTAWATAVVRPNTERSQNVLCLAVQGFLSLLLATCAPPVGAGSTSPGWLRPFEEDAGVPGLYKVSRRGEPKLCFAHGEATERKKEDTESISSWTACPPSFAPSGLLLHRLHRQLLALVFAPSPVLAEDFGLPCPLLPAVPDGPPFYRGDLLAELQQREAWVLLLGAAGTGGPSERPEGGQGHAGEVLSRPLPHVSRRRVPANFVQSIFAFLEGTSRVKVVAAAVLDLVCIASVQLQTRLLKSAFQAGESGSVPETRAALSPAAFSVSPFSVCLTYETYDLQLELRRKCPPADGTKGERPDQLSRENVKAAREPGEWRLAELLLPEGLLSRGVRELYLKEPMKEYRLLLLQLLLLLLGGSGGHSRREQLLLGVGRKGHSEKREPFLWCATEFMQQILADILASSNTVPYPAAGETEGRSERTSSTRPVGGDLLGAFSRRRVVSNLGDLKILRLALLVLELLSYSDGAASVRLQLLQQTVLGVPPLAPGAGHASQSRVAEDSAVAAGSEGSDALAEPGGWALLHCVAQLLLTTWQRNNWRHVETWLAGPDPSSARDPSTIDGKLCLVDQVTRLQLLAPAGVPGLATPYPRLVSSSGFDLPLYASLCVSEKMEDDAVQQGARGGVAQDVGADDSFAKEGTLPRRASDAARGPPRESSLRGLDDPRDSSTGSRPHENLGVPGLLGSPTWDEEDEEQASVAALAGVELCGAFQSLFRIVTAQLHALPERIRAGARTRKLDVQNNGTHGSGAIESLFVKEPPAVEDYSSFFSLFQFLSSNCELFGAFFPCPCSMDGNPGLTPYCSTTPNLLKLLSWLHLQSISPAHLHQWQQSPSAPDTRCVVLSQASPGGAPPASAAFSSPCRADFGASAAALEVGLSPAVVLPAGSTSASWLQEWSRVRSLEAFMDFWARQRLLGTALVTAIGGSPNGASWGDSLTEVFSPHQLPLLPIPVVRACGVLSSPEQFGCGFLFDKRALLFLSTHVALQSHRRKKAVCQCRKQGYMMAERLDSDRQGECGAGSRLSGVFNFLQCNARPDARGLEQRRRGAGLANCPGTKAERQALLAVSAATITAANQPWAAGVLASRVGIGEALADSQLCLLGAFFQCLCVSRQKAIYPLFFLPPPSADGLTSKHSTRGLVSSGAQEQTPFVRESRVAPQMPLDEYEPPFRAATIPVLRTLLQFCKTADTSFRSNTFRLLTALATQLLCCNWATDLRCCPPTLAVTGKDVSAAVVSGTAVLHPREQAQAGVSALRHPDMSGGSGRRSSESSGGGGGGRSEHSLRCLSVSDDETSSLRGVSESQTGAREQRKSCGRMLVDRTHCPRIDTLQSSTGRTALINPLWQREALRVPDAPHPPLAFLSRPLCPGGVPCLPSADILHGVKKAASGFASCTCCGAHLQSRRCQGAEAHDEEEEKGDEASSKHGRRGQGRLRGSALLLAVQQALLQVVKKKLYGASVSRVLHYSSVLAASEEGTISACGPFQLGCDQAEERHLDRQYQQQLPVLYPLSFLLPSGLSSVDTGLKLAGPGTARRRGLFSLSQTASALARNAAHASATSGVDCSCLDRVHGDNDVGTEASCIKTTRHPEALCRSACGGVSLPLAELRALILLKGDGDFAAFGKRLKPVSEADVTEVLAALDCFVTLSAIWNFLSLSEHADVPLAKPLPGVPPSPRGSLSAPAEQALETSRDKKLNEPNPGGRPKKTAAARLGARDNWLEGLRAQLVDLLEQAVHLWGQGVAASPSGLAVSSGVGEHGSKSGCCPLVGTANQESQSSAERVKLCMLILRSDSAPALLKAAAVLQLAMPSFFLSAAAALLDFASAAAHACRESVRRRRRSSHSALSDNFDGHATAEGAPFTGGGPSEAGAVHLQPLLMLHPDQGAVGSSAHASGSKSSPCYSPRLSFSPSLDHFFAGESPQPRDGPVVKVLELPDHSAFRSGSADSHAVPAPACLDGFEPRVAQVIQQALGDLMSRSRQRWAAALISDKASGSSTSRELVAGKLLSGMSDGPGRDVEGLSAPLGALLGLPFGPLLRSTVSVISDQVQQYIARQLRPQDDDSSSPAGFDRVTEWWVAQARVLRFQPLVRLVLLPGCSAVGQPLRNGISAFGTEAWARLLSPVEDPVTVSADDLALEELSCGAATAVFAFLVTLMQAGAAPPNSRGGAAALFSSAAADNAPLVAASQEQVGSFSSRCDTADVFPSRPCRYADSFPSSLGEWADCASSKSRAVRSAVGWREPTDEHQERENIDIQSGGRRHGESVSERTSKAPVRASRLSATGLITRLPLAAAPHRETSVTEALLDEGFFLSLVMLPAVQNFVTPIRQPPLCFSSSAWHSFPLQQGTSATLAGRSPPPAWVPAYEALVGGAPDYLVGRTPSGANSHLASSSSGGQLLLVRRSVAHLLFCRMLQLLGVALRCLAKARALDDGTSERPFGRSSDTKTNNAHAGSSPKKLLAPPLFPGDSADSKRPPSPGGRNRSWTPAGLGGGTCAVDHRDKTSDQGRRLDGVLRVLQACETRMTDTLGPSGFLLTGQLALLEEAALYVGLLKLLPKWRSLLPSQQVFVWRWFSLCREFCLALSRRMEQSLLEVGGNAVLRPVSFLERAASCLPSTGRSGLPTSTRGVTESGDSSSIDAAWRGRKGDNLEGFGQTGLIAGFPGRRFAGRVVEMQGGILTAGGRSHEFLHRTLRQRDEPLYRKLRAPEDAFFGVGDRAHAGTGEGGAEDGDDLRRESATTAVPSTFHQRGIFLMAKICHDFVSAFSNLQILIPLSHTYPPPASFFLPGCKCCHPLSSKPAPSGCADSQAWCTRVCPVTSEQYVEVLSENPSSEPSGLPRLPKDSVQTSRKKGGSLGVPNSILAGTSICGQQRLSPDTARAMKGLSDSSSETESRRIKTLSGQAGRRRSISTEEGRSASTATRSVGACPARGEEGSGKAQQRRKVSSVNERRLSFENAATALERSTELTARAKTVSMDEAKRRLRGRLLPTVQEVAETLGVLLAVSGAIARILEELPRLDRRVFCAVSTSSGRRMLPLSLSLRCEGPALAPQRSSSWRPAAYSRSSGGAGDLLQGSPDSLMWPRSPTPGTATPRSVCDHRTGGIAGTGAVSPSGRCSRGRSLEREGARLIGGAGLGEKGASARAGGGAPLRDGGSTVSLHRGEGCASTERPAPTVSITASSLGRQRAERRRGGRPRIRRGSPTLTTVGLRRLSELPGHAGFDALPRGYAFSLRRTSGVQPVNGLFAGNEEEELECVCPDLLVLEALWEIMRTTVEKAVKAGAAIVNALVSQNVLRTYADTAKKFLLLLIHLGQICPPVSPPSFLPPGAFPPASGHLRRQQASGNTVPRNPPGRGTASLDAGVQEERRDEEPLAESDPTSGEFYRILLQYVLRRYGVDEKLADTSTDKAVAGPLLLLYPGDDPQH